MGSLDNPGNQRFTDPDLVPPLVDLSRRDGGIPNNAPGQPARPTDTTGQTAAPGRPIDTTAQTGTPARTGASAPETRDPVVSQRDNNADNPLRDGLAEREGPYNTMWLADRGLSAVATAWAGASKIDALAARIPAQGAIRLAGENYHNFSSIRSIPGNEWSKAVTGSELGRVMSGAWISDTVMDQVFFRDKQTSLLTVGVDVATPFLAKTVLEFARPFASKYTTAATILIAAGAHAIEKAYEDDR